MSGFILVGVCSTSRSGPALAILGSPGGSRPPQLFSARPNSREVGPAGLSPAPWDRRCARGGGSNNCVRLVFCGTPEKKTSTNTNCRVFCGRGRPSELKVRSGRRLDHRDEAVAHLVTHARPGGRRTRRRTARRSAHLDRSGTSPRALSRPCSLMHVPEAIGLAPERG